MAGTARARRRRRCPWWRSSDGRTSASRRSSTASCGRAARSSTTPRASRATASWRARRTAGARSLCVDTGGFLADDPARSRRARGAGPGAGAGGGRARRTCVVCVLDGAAGLAPADRDTVRLLARGGKPVLFVGEQDRHGRPRGTRARSSTPPASTGSSRCRRRTTAASTELLDAVVARAARRPPTRRRRTAARGSRWSGGRTSASRRS